MAELKRWLVIVNPSSGNGAGKRKWHKIKKLLAHYGFSYSFNFTKYSNHSTELTQSAVTQGYRQFICVGGDGTIHNIVNGIMIQKTVPSSKISLGVIPVGTGNDWVKTYGIPKNIKKAICLIKKGSVQHQDIGKLKFADETLPSVYFNNLVGIGFDGYVVSKVKNYKYLGSASYLMCALVTLFRFKNFRTNVILNSEKISTNALMVLIGLCRYSGGGMQLTKNPDPQDGCFDISIAENFGKMDILSNVVKLFNGKIVNSKKIITAKVSNVTVEIVSSPSQLVQADGEFIGCGNFKVTLLPKTFSFYA